MDVAAPDADTVIMGMSYQQRFKVTCVHAGMPRRREVIPRKFLACVVLVRSGGDASPTIENATVVLRL